jgi:hypothetical protein
MVEKPNVKRTRQEITKYTPPRGEDTRIILTLQHVTYHTTSQLAQRLQIDLPGNTWAAFLILNHPSCSASLDQWHFSTAIVNTSTNSEVQPVVSFKRN